MPIGEIDEALLFSLQEGILQTFDIQTRIRIRHFDFASAYDPIRDQYNSSGLLVHLIKDIPPGTLKVLGVTDLDLCITHLHFSFGEAQLNGTGAVVSAHRLHNQFYGIPETRARLSNRIVKEGIHELGHTFGLIHCAALRCVMNTSTYVEEMDQKPPFYREFLRKAGAPLAK